MLFQTFKFPSAVLSFLAILGCQGVQRTVEIRSDPPGATVFIDDEQAGKTVLTKDLQWVTKAERQRGRRIRLSAPNHHSAEIVLTYEEARLQPSNKPWTISTVLPLLIRKLPVTITSNVEAAEVVVKDKVIGTTPLRHDFHFARSTPEAPWSEEFVVVRKSGYRAKSVGETTPEQTAPYSCQLTVSRAEEGSVAAELEPIRFVSTPIKYLVPSEAGMTLIEETLLSQIGDVEREPNVRSVMRITNHMPEEALLLSRLSVSNDNSSVLLSLPVQAARDAGSSEYVNLWLKMIDGGGRTRLTNALHRDVEGTLSPDGKHTYFSSDRLGSGRFNLWRVETTGGIGHQKLTDSPSAIIDTEPAVSPNGQYIAFTSYAQGSKTPYIWTCSSDGTQQKQLRVGRTPCWSPDGTRIVFVAPDSAGREKLWVMNANGSQPTILTAGEHTDQYPVWTPDGKRLIYASNQAVDVETRQRNFDIWMMNANGTGDTRLTINASLDTRPAISADGKYIYFMSNRGAQKEKQAALQVWRLELLEPAKDNN